jgi:hypothetical protein
MPVIGAEKVIAAFQAFERNLLRHVEDVPYEIKSSIVREIVRTRSIDTARMIQAENYHQTYVSDGDFRYEVDTSSNPDVFYDGFVDQPGVTRNWAGRFFNQRGIEGANIERIFNEIAADSFVI